jgi:hypothetical protein
LSSPSNANGAGAVGAELVVVHVTDAISTALAGHEGVEYRSPPLPQEEAIALVRVLVGDDSPTTGRRCWRCPIAGGQRTVRVAPAPTGATPATRG